MPRITASTAAKNRATSSHPYQNVRIKDGLEEVRWRYLESEPTGEVHILDGTPFIGDLSRAVPIRTGAKYHGRFHHEGLHVLGETGEQVWYESMAEHVALLQIEQNFSIKSVTSQPCCLLLRGEMAHYPDYAVKTKDAATVLIDVRPAHLVTARDEQKFQSTAHICEQLGWGYSIIEPLQGYARHNMVWLAGFRHWYAAPDHALYNRIMATTSSPMRLIDIGRLLDPELEWHYLPAIYHLMFKAVLSYDEKSPLSDDTLVWKS